MSHSLEVCITYPGANDCYICLGHFLAIFEPMHFIFASLPSPFPSHAGKSDGTVFSPTAVQAKDRYAQEYMNSLGRRGRIGGHPPNA